MLTPLGDVAALVALLTGIVTIALQIVKPLIELRLPPSNPAHDSVLRLLNLALQAGLLVAVRLTLAPFAALTWLDILALAFGQGMLAHAGYQLVRAGVGTPPIMIEGAPFVRPDAATPPVPLVGGQTSGA